MMHKYVIGDTHFGHHNIIKFESEARPFETIEEHNEELVKRWNETVKPEDTVYHLGDVFFRKESFEYVKRLNGTKILIMGNHDHYLKAGEYEEVFHKVLGVKIYKDVIMTHYPVHPGQFSRFAFNIHGHVHSKSLEDLRYINVSAEVTGLRPVLLDELIEERRAQVTNE